MTLPVNMYFLFKVFHSFIHYVLYFVLCKMFAKVSLVGSFSFMQFIPLFMFYPFIYLSIVLNIMYTSDSIILFLEYLDTFKI